MCHQAHREPVRNAEGGGTVGRSGLWDSSSETVGWLATGEVTRMEATFEAGVRKLCIHLASGRRGEVLTNRPYETIGSYAIIAYHSSPALSRTVHLNRQGRQARKEIPHIQSYSGERDVGGYRKILAQRLGLVAEA